VTKECLYCEKEFEPYRHQKYCSLSCHGKAYYRRLKDRVKNGERGSIQYRPGQFQPLLCPHGVLGKSKCPQCQKDRNAAYDAAHPDRGKRLNKAKRLANSRRSRGIPIFDGLSKTEECPLCYRILQLVPDHDHDTGQFRGWICGNCNRMMGVYERLKKDGRLAKMQVYLKETFNG
jgi:hypothetical protein